ncbi:hypothetical protein fugu_009409 [Takifugu bimaculatus]|uniref:Uncharacterized protein n=1 Tax=Takifugu bimaculatus TaxID=433685 RepID=A0A4Z2AYX0_9TELE|nr:hypothetical protein fugu_009409 [Takifugu bimaculatus]
MGSLRIRSDVLAVKQLSKVLNQQLSSPYVEITTLHAKPFVGMECLMTSLVDLFPNFLRKGCRRELLLLAICSTCCLLGLSLVTEGTFIFSIVKYTPLRFSDTYVYPLWANILGWFIATISLSLIPLFVLYKVARGEGTLRQRFLSLCQPEDELPLKQECLSMPGTIGTTGNIELNPLSHAGERNQ